jgi:F-box/leucine-rich repeat protein 7
MNIKIRFNPHYRITNKLLCQSFCCALSDTATEVLALQCSNLKYLNMSFCGSAISDPSLRSIGLHLLSLEHLSVRGCVRVTGVGVEAVAEGCHQLQVFDVSQCKNLISWLDDGGAKRYQSRIKFETVAPNKRKSG